MRTHFLVLNNLDNVEIAINSSPLQFSLYFFSQNHPANLLTLRKGVEMVGPKKREMSGVLLNYFYSIGEALLGLLFWLYPNWVVLQLLVSVPPLLFIGYYWIVPESVRWLLARKDYTQAKKIIRKAARINGVQLSDHVMQSFELKSPNVIHIFHISICSVVIVVESISKTKHKQSNL